MATRAELLDLLPRVDKYMAESIKEELNRPLVGDRALFIGITEEWHGTITEVKLWYDEWTVKMRTDDGKLDVTAPEYQWQKTVDGWIIRWQDATTLRTYQ